MVNVGVDPEQTLEYRLGNGGEILGETYAWFEREDSIFLLVLNLWNINSRVYERK